MRRSTLVGGCGEGAAGVARCPLVHALDRRDDTALGLVERVVVDWPVRYLGAACLLVGIGAIERCLLVLAVDGCVVGTF